MIITGEEDGGEENDDGLHVEELEEVLVTGELQLEDEEEEEEDDEELVDDVEDLLEEQVVVEDGVQYEIELE